MERTRGLQVSPLKVSLAVASRSTEHLTKFFFLSLEKIRRLSLSHTPGTERGGLDWGEALYFDLGQMEEEIGRYIVAGRRCHQDELERFAAAMRRRIKDMSDVLDERMMMMRTSVYLQAEDEGKQQERIGKKKRKN